MQNVTGGGPDTAGTLSSPGDGEAANDDRIVSDAVGLLSGGTPGILLTGPRAQALVLRILDRPLSFAPIFFEAAGGTIERLRAAVERVHATRADPSTMLLLVVDDADRLTTELLQELELAAAAAAELGGLKFLFVARQQLAAGLRQRGFRSLADCLQTSLRCVAQPIVRNLDHPVGRTVPARPDEPPARLFPVLAAGGILALLGVTLTVGIVRLRRPPAMPETQTPQVASLAMLPARPAMPPPQVPSPPLVVAPPPDVTVVAPARAPVPAPSSAQPLPAASAQPLPAASLLLIAGPGDTLQSLYAEVYRGITPPPLAQVASINPAVVTVGTRLVFPTPAAGWAHAR